MGPGAAIAEQPSIEDNNLGRCDAMSDVDPCRVRQVGGPRERAPAGGRRGAYPDKDSDLAALGIDNAWSER